MGLRITDAAELSEWFQVNAAIVVNIDIPAETVYMPDIVTRLPGC